MIVASDISKSFGNKVAVSKASFSVEKGEIVGLLGPNGAGKSTLLRTMTGYLIPDGGSVRLGGIDLFKNPIKAKSTFGYLPESASCYSQMTVTEYLTYLLKLRGVAKKDRAALIEKAIGICYLDSVRNQVIETLSKGYTHRVCLAQSIAHDPEIYLFDEPTDGLDPNQKKEVRNLIVEKSKDKAIIFSTHILEEVEAICTKVVMMAEGKVVFIGTPEEVKNLYSSWDHIRVTITESILGKSLSLLQQLHSVAKATFNEEAGSGIYEVSLSDSLDSFIRELPSVLDQSQATLEAIVPARDGLAYGFAELTAAQ